MILLRLGVKIYLFLFNAGLISFVSMATNKNFWSSIWKQTEKFEIKATSTIDDESEVLKRLNTLCGAKEYIQGGRPRTADQKYFAQDFLIIQQHKNGETFFLKIENGEAFPKHALIICVCILLLLLRKLRNIFYFIYVLFGKKYVFMWAGFHVAPLWSKTHASRGEVLRELDNDQR